MVRLKASRQILIILAGLILGCTYTGSAFAGQLWSNRTGSLVRSSDGSANWISYDYWNNLLSQASADGAGGVVSTANESVLVANEVMVPMTMTEASSAADLAAAAAFLPEAAIYAIVGGTLGTLVWDSLTQSYEVPNSASVPPPATCADGSVVNWYQNQSPWAELASLQKYGNYELQAVQFGATLNTTNQIVAAGPSSAVGTYIYYYPSSTQTSISHYEFTLTPCSDGSTPTTGPLTPQIIPPAQLVPYVLPWLQSNPNSAPQLAQKEAASGDYPQASPPLLTGPSSVSLPPVTTTTTNPDGSTTKTTKQTTETITYSGPNASASPTTTTTTTTTPAPTASNPTPSPTSTTTSTTSTPVAPPSSAPASAPSPFMPPDASVPTVPPVPPGVIQLPLPNIDTTAGQCPAPIVMQLGLPGLQTATLDLTPWCNLAGELKPLVLTAGALAAMFILVK